MAMGSNRKAVDALWRQFNAHSGEVDTHEREARRHEFEARDHRRRSVTEGVAAGAVLIQLKDELGSEFRAECNERGYDARKISHYLLLGELSPQKGGNSPNCSEQPDVAEAVREADLFGSPATRDPCDLGQYATLADAERAARRLKDERTALQSRAKAQEERDAGREWTAKREDAKADTAERRLARIRPDAVPGTPAARESAPPPSPTPPPPAEDAPPDFAELDRRCAMQGWACVRCGGPLEGRHAVESWVQPGNRYHVPVEAAAHAWCEYRWVDTTHERSWRELEAEGLHFGGHDAARDACDAIDKAIKAADLEAALDEAAREEME